MIQQHDLKIWAVGG